MNKEQQIKEIEAIIERYYHPSVLAADVYNAGYRKESETAKEICLKIIKDLPEPIKAEWKKFFNKEYGVEID